MKAVSEQLIYLTLSHHVAALIIPKWNNSIIFQQIFGLVVRKIQRKLSPHSISHWSLSVELIFCARPLSVWRCRLQSTENRDFFITDRKLSWIDCFLTTCSYRLLGLPRFHNFYIGTFFHKLNFSDKLYDSEVAASNRSSRNINQLWRWVNDCSTTHDTTPMKICVELAKSY